ncbi:hypothetical protein [Arenibacter sp. F20364]|uniref:hypothetical protein n=1 Tax=Arenibacter sp. F20364 TaxID=2926415 RepID=UPI001FF1ED87|nr:hypothetical protein [Arenibacter sp. F20364]MCK0189760.1 hypothetical protein [Arenibacter sp. F20364]
MVNNSPDIPNIFLHSKPKNNADFPKLIRGLMEKLEVINTIAAKDTPLFRIKGIKPQGKPSTQ